MTDVTTATLTAVEGSVPTPPPPPGWLPGARAGAIAFLLLIALPPIAYAFGVRPPAAENRTPTSPPAVGGVAALEPDALAQLTDHLIDALPGRDAAIRADAWLDLVVFGASPSEDVLIGADDWLFLRPTVDARCRSDAEVLAMGAELERAADLVARTGRELHTLIAPDKATMYPDRLPALLPDSDCGQRFGEQIRRLLEHDPPLGYVPFWSRLEDLRDRAGEPIYFAADTHWRTEGSAVMVEAIVDTFDDSLFDTAVPRRLEPTPFQGDLTLLTGLPRTEVEAPLVLERPGITWESARRRDVPEVGPGVPGLDASRLRATGGEVVPGRVTMLHDSFAYMTPPQLGPFFAELFLIRKHAATVPWVGGILSGSEHIVFEVVERDAWWRIVEDHLAASLAAALRDDLPTTSGWLRPSGAGGWAPLELRRGDVLVVPSVVDERVDGTYRLQVRAPGGEVVELRSQQDARAGEELVFDTVGLGASRALPVGTVEARLVHPDGTAVEETLRLDVVATR
ncbi:MAG: hypothetical protein KY457_11360 [Actinobacteria bacterium]|nr:hypothetical protein [Actinomycetota bacterium]